VFAQALRAQAGAVQVLTTVLKLVPLLLIGVLGWWWVDPANFAVINRSGQSDLAAISAAAAITLWAFLGLESATVPAGEVVDPVRTIPRATIFGVLLAACVYMAVSAVTMGVLPAEQLSASSAPLADVARLMWGEIGGVLVAVGAVIATFGTLNGFTLLTGQVPYGAALDRVFPHSLGHLSRFGTPANALVFSNLLASILVVMNFAHGLVGAFNAIILLAVMASLVPYAFCALAELMIRLKGAEGLRGAALLKVSVLGGLGFLYSGWAIYGAGAETVYLGTLLLLAAALLVFEPPALEAAAPGPLAGADSGFLPLVSQDEWRRVLADQRQAAVWLMPTELPRERLALLGLPYDTANTDERVRAELMLHPSGQLLAVRFVP